MPNQLEKATFAAGCFWQVEVEFRNTDGVKDAIVGYTGGSAERPSYEEVCTGSTGHAEAVEVSFDPDEVSYSELLDVFWGLHDPTQMNRQGPDVGTQYRSAVFYYDDAQKAAAEAMKAAAGEAARRPIATEITAAPTFWPAEDYHQQYDEKRMAASARLFGGWKR